MSNLFYKALKWLSRIFESIFKDVRRLLIALIAAVLFIILISRYAWIFYTILLIFLGSISMLYVRFFRHAHYVGFELCMMATVLTALEYGPVVGAFTGFVSLTGALILSSYFKPTYFISVLTLPLIGIITPFFSGLELWQLGLLMTLVYDIIVLPLYLMMGSRMHSTAIFFITHLLLNLWIFSTLAPFLRALMVT